MTHPEFPDTPLSDESLQKLVVFPLPNAVLFPQTLLPLHIFEPRYREMTQYVIERDLPLAIAQLEPGYETQYHERPPIEPVIGVGNVVAHEQLPDGRYHLVLRGNARAKVLEEHPAEHSWREVRAQIIPPTLSDAQAASAHLQTLRGCLMSLPQIHPRLATFLSRRLQEIEDPSDLADNILAALLPDLDSRQKALAEPDAVRRLEMLVQCVTNVMLEQNTFNSSYN